MTLLSDAEPQLRRRAALAIGRVGLREGIEPLAVALADPEVEVRQMAAFALGLIGGAAAIPALVEALADPAAIVQGRAAEALGRIGAMDSAGAIGEVARRYVTAALPLAPDDTAVPQAPEVEAFRLAVHALGELRAYEPLAAVVLQADGQPVLWWWPVSYALQRTQDPRTLDALVTLAGVEGTVSVAFAAEGLGRIGVADDRVLDALTALLDRRRHDDRVVATAVRALGRLDDRRAATALRQFAIARELPPMLRIAALDALSEQSAGESTDLYVELMSARVAPVRIAAIRGLARTDPSAFLRVLSSLPPDADWRVRAALADGLAHVGADAAEYQLKLRLSREEDSRVVPAVLRSLAEHPVSDLAQVLVDHLRAEDVVVRATAAGLLGAIGAENRAVAMPALIAAYEAGRADPTYRARAAILGALVSTAGIEEVRATVEGALDDPDWPVRLKAAELLEELGVGAQARAEAAPAPGRRSVDFTDPELIRPAVSPHVYIETERGTIELELAVIDAPVVAQNFAMLARRGFYDGLTFHHVVPNDVVRGGDPRGDGEGGPGYTLRDELGPRPYLRGTVGLVRDGADTGGSQFFIAYSPQPQLDGRYTVFAHVVDGMEVVDQLVPGDEIMRVWVWDGADPPGI